MFAESAVQLSYILPLRHSRSQVRRGETLSALTVVWCSWYRENQESTERQVFVSFAMDRGRGRGRGCRKRCHPNRQRKEQPECPCSTFTLRWRHLKQGWKGYTYANASCSRSSWIHSPVLKEMIILSESECNNVMWLLCNHRSLSYPPGMLKSLLDKKHVTCHMSQLFSACHTWTTALSTMTMCSYLN